MLGQDKKAQEFANIHDNFVESIDKVLWNSTQNIWLDFNTKTGKQNPKFYPSNISPLWADCYV